MLVLQKCTMEKNDRDDVTFEMSFDYEFVEDFHKDVKKEPSAASNKTFGDSETDSANVSLGEDEEVDAVQLEEVVTHTDGGKRTVLRDKPDTKG